MIDNLNPSHEEYLVNHLPQIIVESISKYIVHDIFTVHYWSLIKNEISNIQYVLHIKHVMGNKKICKGDIWYFGPYKGNTFHKVIINGICCDREISIALVEQFSSDGNNLIDLNIIKLNNVYSSVLLDCAF